MNKPVELIQFSLNGQAAAAAPGETILQAARQDPMPARALQAVIEEGRRRGRPPLVFAVVYPFSAHNYELRYWLATGGHVSSCQFCTVQFPGLGGEPAGPSKSSSNR